MSAPMPADLPSIANARLPKTYETAKAALAECTQIDECKDWADKAEAMAAYARMSEDDALRKMANKVKAQAIRRCGELLKQYDGRGNNQHKVGGRPIQRAAASDAGMSEHQQKQAVRVASVPEEVFTAQVESDNPPTVTALAEQGKTPRPLVDLQGRDPEEYSLATSAQGHLRDFAAFAARTDPAAVARGTKPHEATAIRQHIGTLDAWLDVLAIRLEE